MTGRYYRKGTHDDFIQGVLEVCEIAYPIMRGDGATWTYAGGQFRVFDEYTEPRKNKAGQTLFITSTGVEVPESEIEWRED